jgi:L-glyceraldehyde 3-phosphate reductase
MLTGKYLKGIPADSRIARDPSFLKSSALDNRSGSSRVADLAAIAEERGQDLAQMALSWILKDSEVCSVLIGASRAVADLDNIAAVHHSDFTEEELKRIDAIAARVPYETR